MSVYRNGPLVLNCFDYPVIFFSLSFLLILKFLDFATQEKKEEKK